MKQNSFTSIFLGTKEKKFLTIVYIIIITAYLLYAAGYAFGRFLALNKF